MDTQCRDDAGNRRSNLLPLLLTAFVAGVLGLLVGSEVTRRALETRLRETIRLQDPVRFREQFGAALKEAAALRVLLTKTWRESKATVRPRGIRRISTDGQFVQLGDGTLYEIAPQDRSRAQGWLLGDHVGLIPRQRNLCRLVTSGEDGAAVDAERIGAVGIDPSSLVLPCGHRWGGASMGSNITRCEQGHPFRYTQGTYAPID